MSSIVQNYKQELLKVIEELPSEKIKEVLDFVYFIKMKDSLEPSQAYFWTENWQKLERDIEADKKAGKIIGDGTVDSLLEELKK